MKFKEGAGAYRSELQNPTESGAQPEKMPEMPLSIVTYPAAITGC